ncbi:outer membrane protein transport protein [Desulforhopalus vacuolatus]|uniref:OmpP1/FadL family transporter n=1 Tax=Desulforhopalus vacuolatus TaxID=40414 RepID=UPI001965B07F|nr:outer membrane protein transport protein [Desulforhopalus vacuolatus]MBM9519271.1 outer membrane protein transport protein [Desulforhopalus vacuolatus]
MKKCILCVAATLLACPAGAMASGWRIPEQSVDSTAKAGANIASSSHADTAYYNPARMGFLEDRWQVEADLTYIYLSAVEYEDARTSAYNDTSEDENFFIPTGFMVSPDFGGTRFGLSVTAPYGLAKHWKSGYGKAFVEEFSLEVIEINPVVSYTFNDWISIAAGPRLLLASGSVKSDATVIGTELGRSVDTDKASWGWNAAVDVRPMTGLDLAVTWRSYVDMKFDDTVNLNLMGTEVSPTADLSIPAPAVLAVSVAYDVTDSVNVELTWDRTFWSEYDTFDFNFHTDIPGNPFEAPVARNWEDSDAFRLGITWKASSVLTLMGGFAYDQSPVNDATLDFSVPDADAWIYSLGAQYKVSENLELGLAALYDYKQDRTNKADPTGVVYGKFSNASALLITGSVSYMF